MSGVASREFQDCLTGLLPKMRTWATAFTQNRVAAEDLVQDVAMKALVANASFVPGTNFSAWIYRIMFNHFVSGVRSQRDYRDFEQVPEVGVPSTQQDRTDLRELSVFFGRLPQDQQQALRLIALEEQSYDEAADATGWPVGTLKSRVHRARLQLRSEMLGESNRVAA